ncbi:MAG: RsmB/NOP family class I SAM-dependent RNA methyltransferase [Bacteroidetes bacterium]|nr:RsmB/NOP family class I SAM-dependent RNA methyltransferase [Bacteroidota bacterium]
MSTESNYIKFITTNLKIADSIAQRFLDGAVPVSVRVNANKHAVPPSEDCVAWCKYGYYLPQRPKFTLDPHFHQGRYYVQEASSMFIGYVVNALKLNEKPITVLDACAAPGGKSTLLLDYLHAESILISNEVIASRTGSLQYNMAKWGNMNSIVTQSSIESFAEAGELFELILLDAPCSGEGMFRKDKEALHYWSEESVKLNAARQKKLLTDAWQLLKPGGYIIYSTCTYNTYENEENILWAIENLKAENIAVKSEAEGIFPSAKKY